MTTKNHAVAGAGATNVVGEKVVGEGGGEKVEEGRWRSKQRPDHKRTQRALLNASGSHWEDSGEDPMF